MMPFVLDKDVNIFSWTLLCCAKAGSEMAHNRKVEYCLVVKCDHVGWWVEHAQANTRKVQALGKSEVYVCTVELNWAPLSRWIFKSGQEYVLQLAGLRFFAALSSRHCNWFYRTFREFWSGIFKKTPWNAAREVAKYVRTIPFVKNTTWLRSLAYCGYAYMLN